MLTLDEIIAHCDEVIHKLYQDEGWCLDLYENNATADHKERLDNCRACIDEHKQLLELLKELKWYRETYGEKKEPEVALTADGVKRVCVMR